MGRGCDKRIPNHCRDAKPAAPHTILNFSSAAHSVPVAAYLDLGMKTANGAHSTSRHMTHLVYCRIHICARLCATNSFGGKGNG